MQIIIMQHGCHYDVRWPADRRLEVLYTPRDLHYPDNPWNHWYAGPVDPLNAALANVRGAYIARIDDDDTWEPDHLEKALAYLNDGDFEFVSFTHATHKNISVPCYGLPPRRNQPRGVMIGGTQTWVYRSYLKMFKYNRQCWRNRANRVNDTDLQYRMYRAGVRMGYLNEVHAHVLPRPGETKIGLAAYIGDAHGT
jgi:glycosyltransferase involved in cell wall biosynthesis